MSFPGAAPPLEGVIPDLAHPQDVLRTVNYVTQALTIFFVTIFVGIRFYAKTRLLGGGFTADDCGLMCIKGARAPAEADLRKQTRRIRLMYAT